MPARITRADRVAETEHRIQPPKALNIESDAVAFASETLGFKPLDDWRLDFLANIENRRVVLNCRRQFGKSTMVAIAAIYTALTIPGSPLRVDTGCHWILSRTIRLVFIS